MFVLEMNLENLVLLGVGEKAVNSERESKRKPKPIGLGDSEQHLNVICQQIIGKAMPGSQREEASDAEQPKSMQWQM